MTAVLGETLAGKICTGCKLTKSTDQFYIKDKSTGRLEARCKQCKAETFSRRYQDKREEILEAGQRYRQQNPERVRATRRKSAVKSREQRKLYARKYRKENPEYVRARYGVWKKNNPEGVRAYQLRCSAVRRIRVFESKAKSAPFSVDELRSRWEYYGNKCWICRGAEATANDHVKPLAKGGAHMLCNLRPICKPCNSKKKDKWPL